MRPIQSFTFCALLILAALATAGDNRLVVVTGYHENVSVPFREAFMAANPGVEVTILWHESEAALAAIDERAEGGVDVYWGASPANFHALALAKRLKPLGTERGNLPEHIGDLPLGDPEQHYTAFELAGYGFIVNRTYLEKHKLPAPSDWTDLARDDYAGHLLLPVPSRQGTARLPYEILLQAQGWEKGWRLIMTMAAHADLLPPGTASLSDQVAAGQKGVGLAIDFYARGSVAGHADASFTYPKTAAYSIARVGILADAPHPESARRFVAFLLSTEGQGILLRPGIDRLPVNPLVYRQKQARVNFDPYAVGASTPAPYELELAIRREGVVSALFDAMITEPHAKLVETWRLIQSAEQKAKSDSEALARLAQARDLLVTPPIDETGAGDSEIQALFPLGVDSWSQAARDRYAVWRKRIDGNLEAAVSTARAVLAKSTQ
jgi:ABC-type Fe3+ transport system substrate-binding protein